MAMFSSGKSLVFILYNKHSCLSSVQAEEGFQVEMILRLQCRDLSWTWIYIRANKDPECQSISCTNYIIRYDELLMQPLSDNVSVSKLS